MKYVYIETIGCRPRRLDASKLKNFFEKNNFKVTLIPKKADIIIFNSCAFIESQERYSLRRIEQLQMKYNAELIVTGCIKNINPDGLKKIFSGESFTPSDLDSIDKLFPSFKYKFSELEDSNKLFYEIMSEEKTIRYIYNLLIRFKSFFRLNKYFSQNFLSYITDKLKTRKMWNIRISWGCSKSKPCTFCTIWNSVGKFRSKPLDICIKECKRGVKNGYDSFKITGIDTGAYGIDIGKSFPCLLNEIIDIEGVKRIEIEGMNPKWLIKYLDELVPLIKKGKIKSIESGVQSGSDRILKLMNRQSTSEQMKESFSSIKKTYPGISLKAHVIVGFPSETKTDIIKTLNLIKECGFDSVWIYPFHAKKRTPAYKMEEKIPREIIQKRIDFLRNKLEKNKIKANPIRF